MTTQTLPKSPGHPFYQALNRLLDEAGFDEHVERLCEPHYAASGRPSVPPGVYFRMLFVGYFEGLTSQRGIAWRCSDSLALRDFLGVGLEGRVPDHSTMTLARQRLPFEVYQEVFVFVLAIAREKGVLQGKTVAVDSTILEANAAMKSIVRKDTGEDWKEYLRGLYSEEEGGDDEPTDDELRRFDKRRNRKGKKKVSNDEWESPADPDARIARTKDGRTRLTYKAEHVVDLGSGLVLSAEIHNANIADTELLTGAVAQAQENLRRAGSNASVRDVVADSGYHSSEELAAARRAGWRSYVPEPRGKVDVRRRWESKPEGWQAATYANRRRMRASRGKQLQKLRSEKTERTFAHACETGGARRTHTRGRREVEKRYVVHAAGHNLGAVLRHLLGVGTPRSLQDRPAVVAVAAMAVAWLLWRLRWAACALRPLVANETASKCSRRDSRQDAWWPKLVGAPAFSTGC